MHRGVCDVCVILKANQREAACPIGFRDELDMGFPAQIGFHADIVRVNGKVTVTEFPENGAGAEVPTGPCERRISIHVFDVDDRACIQEKLDGLFGAEGCGTVERSFTFRPDVSHEATRFSGFFRHAVGIRATGE